MPPFGFHRRRVTSAPGINREGGKVSQDGWRRTRVRHVGARLPRTAESETATPVVRSGRAGPACRRSRTRGRISGRHARDAHELQAAVRAGGRLSPARRSRWPPAPATPSAARNRGPRRPRRGAGRRHGRPCRRARARRARLPRARLRAQALGGKARSIPVPRSAGRGRRGLPGEHGFRFFPGFYHHVPDSMRRIPVPGNETACGTTSRRHRDQVAAHRGPRGRHPVRDRPDPQETATPEGLQRLLIEELVKQQGVRPDEAEFFANRLQVFLTSCEQRRYGQWEHTDLVGLRARRGQVGRVQEGDRPRPHPQPGGREGDGGQHAHDRQHGRGVRDEHPDPGQRRRPGPGAQRSHQRGLDQARGSHHLRKLGVRFHVGQTVEALEMRKGRIASARARDRRGRRRRIDADWFVCAMPVERARRLWSPRVLGATRGWSR